nr:30S ribosomal protein S2 [Candidatus Woesebacteria bacterium]
EFIYMEKDGVHIFDLEKTASQLQLAYNFVYDMASKGKTMVMVGTKKQSKEIIKEEAIENGTMYIISRWLGGLITNWNQVKGSLKRMIEIDSGLKSGKFDGYTKFEKVQLDKEKTRLERFFGGIQELKSTPDFLFVVDVKREKNAVREAKLMGIPVVALIDSNANPEDVDIAIPANDDALRSIKLIVSEIAKAYSAGKKSAGKSSGVTTAKINEVKQPVKKETEKIVVEAEADVKPKAAKVAAAPKAEVAKEKVAPAKTPAATPKVKKSEVKAPVSKTKKPAAKVSTKKKTVAKK